MAKSADILTQLRDLYASLTLGKKISFLLFMILGIAMFMGVVYFAKQPTYRVLYSSLSAEDLSGIVARLREDKVEYKIGAGGDSISVNEQNFYETKMSLASAGLPRGGSVGFELFDQKSMGMTEFQQRVHYLRAMQGEMERTINKIAAVESSRVHLVLPKEALFKEDQKNPTASVILKLKTNARLTNDEIEGITFLVAGSVEGLESGDVTMLDSRGRVLSKKKSEDVAGPVNSAMIDYRRRLESGMENRIVELISRIVGPEKVAAKVTAALDFRMVTKVEERYDPDNQVVRSEQLKDELNKDSEQNSTGAPGIASNLPQGVTPGGGAASTNQSERKLETVNYEIGKTVSQISEPVGELKKLSVAVLVDGAYTAGKDADGNETKTYAPRSKEEIQKITTLVKNAIGYNDERGDQLVVENVQFNPTFEAPAPLPGVGSGLKYQQIANYVLYGAMLLIVAVMAFTMMRFLTREPSYQAVGEMAGLLPSRVGELETRISEQGPRMLSGPDEESARLSQEQERHRRLVKQRDELKANLAKDDKAVTLMVRKWLKEQKQE